MLQRHTSMCSDLLFSLSHTSGFAHRCIEVRCSPVPAWKQRNDVLNATQDWQLDASSEGREGQFCVYSCCLKILFSLQCCPDFLNGFSQVVTSLQLFKRENSLPRIKILSFLEYDCYRSLQAIEINHFIQVWQVLSKWFTKPNDTPRKESQMSSSAWHVLPLLLPQTSLSYAQAPLPAEHQWLIWASTEGEVTAANLSPGRKTRELNPALAFQPPGLFPFVPKQCCCKTGKNLQIPTLSYRVIKNSFYLAFPRNAFYCHFHYSLWKNWMF